MMPRATADFPAPRSPFSSTTSPGRSIAARVWANAVVASSSPRNRVSCAPSTTVAPRCWRRPYSATPAIATSRGRLAVTRLPRGSRRPTSMVPPCRLAKARTVATPAPAPRSRPAIAGSAVRASTAERRHRQRHRPAWLRRAYGAREQVVEHLDDPGAVGDERRQVGLDVDDEVDRLLAVDVRECRRESCPRLLHQRVYILQLRLQLGDPRVDWRPIEEVVDEDSKGDAGGADIVGIGALLLRQLARRLRGQQIGKADDVGER